MPVDLKQRMAPLSESQLANAHFDQICEAVARLPDELADRLVRAIREALDDARKEPTDAEA